MGVSDKKQKRPVKKSMRLSATHSQLHEIIVDFFDNHEVQEVDEELWEWLTEALTKEHSIFNSAKKRASLIFLYENLKKLIAGLSKSHYSSTKKVK